MLIWPLEQFKAAALDENNLFLAAPISLRRKKLQHDSSVLPSSLNTIIEAENNFAPPAPIEVAAIAVPKRQVPMSLLHHRIGHRSYEAIKFADNGNVWKM